MFWNIADGLSVEISHQMYANSWPVMYFCRLFGYYPISVQKKQSNMFLNWSPHYAIYSLALGLFLAGRSSWDLFTQYVLATPFFIHSPTDKITMVLAHGAWIILFSCGAFVMPCRFLTFFQYVKHIHQVDSVIKTTYKLPETCLWVLMMLVAPALAMFYCINNFRGFINVMGMSFWQAMNFTGAFYVLYIVTVTIFYMVGFLIRGLEQRLRRLNELLEIENLVVKNKHGMKSTNQDNIIQLAKVYLKLCNACDLLNHLFDEAIVVGIVLAFVQIVQPLYFFVATMKENGDLLGNMGASSLAIIRNSYCGLLIIETSYACSKQVKKTEGLICRLMCKNVSKKYKFKIKTFIMCLGLRKIGFSACGLFTVDRGVFGPMFGSTVSLLLLLLQMQENDNDAMKKGK